MCEVPGASSVGPSLWRRLQLRDGYAGASFAFHPRKLENSRCRENRGQDKHENQNLSCAGVRAGVRSDWRYVDDGAANRVGIHGCSAPRPQGPCDIYAAAGDPVRGRPQHVRARSMPPTTARFIRCCGSRTARRLDIGVVQPTRRPMRADTPMRPRRTRSAPTPIAGSPPSTISPASTTT